MVVFLRELQAAWANVIQLDIEVERVESNPQLVQIVPPNEVVVMVSFELSMGNIRGMANLCIPFNTIERVGSMLTNNSWVGYASTRANSETKGRLLTRLDGSLADVWHWKSVRSGSINQFDDNYFGPLPHTHRPDLCAALGLPRAALLFHTHRLRLGKDFSLFPGGHIRC